VPLLALGRVLQEINLVNKIITSTMSTAMLSSANMLFSTQSRAFMSVATLKVQM